MKPPFAEAAVEASAFVSSSVKAALQSDITGDN